MNISKARIKIDMLEGMAKEYDEKARKAAQAKLRQEGARDALKEASVKVGALGENLQKDIESGLVAKCMKDEFELEKYLKRYFKRAAGVCISLSETASSSMLIAEGRRKAHESDSEFVRGQARAELKKLDALQKAIESGRVVVENEDGSVDAPPLANGTFPTGHPGLPMKAQRRAEEEAEQQPQGKQTEEPPPKKSNPPQKKKASRKKAVSKKKE